MLKIGHRGAKGYVAENTIASFQKALDLGVDGIELDVHLSSDREIIVIHDETIDRTTTDIGFVKDFTASQLEKLGIPTLKQVFDLVGNCCFINIEIKDEKVTKYILKFIDEQISNYSWTYDLIQISSFNWTILEHIYNKNNKIALGILTEDSLENAIVFAKKINAFSINPNYQILNKEVVKICKQKKYKIFPWTINNSLDIEKVKELNVDGIISDFPDRVYDDKNIITFNSKKETEIESLDNHSIIWKLNRFKCTQNSMEFFQYCSCNSLNLQITKYKILFLLNSNSFIFDFDYNPKEEDQIILYIKNNPFKYLSFIYKKETWIDSFHNYEIITIEIGSGIVEILK